MKRYTKDEIESMAQEFELCYGGAEAEVIRQQQSDIERLCNMLEFVEPHVIHLQEHQSVWELLKEIRG